MNTEPPTPPKLILPGGFWIRFCADILDSIIISIPAALIVWLLGATEDTFTIQLQLVFTIIGGFYYVLLTAKTGTTWGKQAFGLRVVYMDGTPISSSTSFLRWCAYLPSYVILGVGFMMAGWNAEKRALHDYLVGTRVVRDPKSGNIALKVVGALAAGLVLLLIIGAIFGMSWIKKNAAEMGKEMPAMKEKAAAFGQATDQDGCVTEGLVRLDGASILQEAQVRIFLTECLKTAQPSDGFCTGVPKRDSIMKSAIWSVATCAQLGRSQDQSCSRLLKAVSLHCNPAIP